MPEKNYELLKNSDPTALEKIYAQYSRRIFWLGRQILDDEFVVENLVQDAFLRLWEYRDKLERPMHILFFLRYVMKQSCYTHYYKPRNKFFMTTVRSFESYENFHEYMAGYDPEDVVQNLKDQERDQRFFDLVNKALPLISPERRHLINLCLKYGFQYKEIARVMGKGLTETANEVKRAIEDIKTIVDRHNILENKQKESTELEEQKTISERQSRVLKLRFDKKLSFAAIAQELTLTQKEVHEEFMKAYKFTKQHQNQSL